MNVCLNKSKILNNLNQFILKKFFIFIIIIKIFKTLNYEYIFLKNKNNKIIKQILNGNNFYRQINLNKINNK